MKDLIIIGAGGFGRETAWVAERMNAVKKQWNILGFVDDGKEKGSLVGGYPILGSIDSLATFSAVSIVCSVGNTQLRKKIMNSLKDMDMATLVDPSVIIANRVKIGCGCIICANTVLAVDSKIHNSVIINLASTIGHDAILFDYVMINPSVNVSGNCIIGECSDIGTGTKIIQGMTIHENSIIGAGSVVVKDLPANCTAVGCPAKPIKFHTV